MLIHSENYKISDIKNLAFEKVPRGSFISKTSRIALDYHSDLCNIKIEEIVKIEIYLKTRPEVNKNSYLMRGIVYKIEENKYEASFGGLLLFFEGHLDVNLNLEDEIYISVQKIWKIKLF